MAEQDYRRLDCRRCGVSFAQLIGPGRKAHFCAKTCGKAWFNEKKSAGLAEARERRKCLACGNEFVVTKPAHVYCTRECGVKTRRPVLPVGVRPCAFCAKPFAQATGRAIYCRDTCKVAACFARQGKRRPFARQVESNAQRLEEERFQREGQLARDRAFLALMQCLRRVATRRRREDLDRRRSEMRCIQCGAMFAVLTGQTRLCSDECRIQHSKPFRRAANAARRALERAATVEVFDPEEVLARDGWRCQICGVDTPKRLRGTYKPNAPELDHIVALSRGGEHSRANTQCACRRCNGIKSNGRPLGQIALAFT